MKAKLSTMFVNITELAQSRAFNLSVCGLLILYCVLHLLSEALRDHSDYSGTGRGLVRIGRRRTLLALLARGIDSP